VADDAFGGLHRRDFVFRRHRRSIGDSRGKFEDVDAEEMLEIHACALAIPVCFGRRVTLQVLEVTQQSGMRIKTGGRFLAVRLVAANERFQFDRDVLKRIIRVLEFRAQLVSQ
jgi:hypothetical protein